MATTTADPLRYNPSQAHFTWGDRQKGTPPDTHVTSVKEITVPNWIKRFEFFVSPSGATDSKTVIKEYDDAVREFLMKNPDSSVTDIRKAVGVMVSPDGKEALTSSSFGKAKRGLREFQQRPDLRTREGVRGQRKNYPPKLQNQNVKQFTKQLSDTLEEAGIKVDVALEDLDWEGHHIKGLGTLNPFFEGAGYEEAFELQQSMINRGFTAGETKGNFSWLSPEQHDLAHKIYQEDYDFEPIGKKGQSMIGQTKFKRSKEFLENLKKAPFKPTPGKLTRKDYLMDWLDLTEGEFNTAVETAIRRKPIPGIDPEEQIKANIRHRNPQIANDIAAIDMRGTNGWSLNGAMKASVGLNKAESVVRIMGGDYIGGALGLAMTSPAAQNLIKRQLGKLAIQAIPGVSLGSGALQALGYMKGGNWTKAGLSFMGGIIGEIPGYGDVIQSGIDLGLTGHDVVTKPKGFKKPKPNIPDEDSLYRTLRGLGENMSINPGKYL